MAPIPVALPQTLGGSTTLVSALFSAAAGVGVKLEKLTHDPGGTPLDFTTFLIDAAVEELDGRLWEIAHTRELENTEYPTKCSPKHAAAFAAFDITADEGLIPYGGNPAALLFRWTGIALPGAAAGDTIKVELKAVLRSTSHRVIEWKALFDRESGESVSIDDIRAPIVWLKGPSSTDGTFPTHHEAQKRTRVLNNAQDIFLTGESAASEKTRNMTLWSLANGGLSYERSHPGVSHVAQFFAVCGVNNTPDAAYLKAFWVGTEDDDWHIKRFGFKGYRHDPSGVNEGYIQLYTEHVPPYGKMLTTSERSFYGNTWEMPYYATTGVVPCVDDHWWWDLYDFYLTRVAMPPVLEDPASPLSTTLTDGGMYFAHAQLLDKFDGVGWAEHVLDISKKVIEIVETDQVKTLSLNHIVQLQMFLRTTINQVENIDRPWNNDGEYALDDGLYEVFQRAAGENIWFIGYSRPIDMGSDRVGYPPYSTRVVRMLRDGSVEVNVAPKTGVNFIRFDTGSQAWVDWWIEGPARTYLAAGFAGGAYLDVLSGQGPLLAYPTDFSEHLPHGGNHGTIQRRDLITRIRALINGPGRQWNVPVGVPIVISESIEEGVHDLCDLTQHSYHYADNAIDYEAEAVVRPDLGAIPNVADEARNLAPPMFSAIYHHTHRGLWNPPALSNHMLSSNTDWNPSNGKVGLTWEQFLELRALWLAQSYLAGFISAASFVHDTMVDLAGGQSDALWITGARSRDSSEKDPTNAGDKIMDFLRALHELQAIRVYGGQFLRVGVYQRPLFVDSLNSDREANPVAALQFFDFIGDTPARDGSGARGLCTPDSQGAPGSGPWNHLYGAYDTYRVLHSVWKSPPAPAPAPNGRLGLVLANWYRASAEWRATMDLTKYGLGTVAAKQLDKDGIASTIASGLSGVITIGTDPTMDVDLGANIGTRTAKVIVFE